MLILAYVVHPTLPPPQLWGGGGISASPIFQPFRLQFNNTVAQLNIKQLSDTFYGSISTSKHLAVRINQLRSNFVSYFVHCLIVHIPHHLTKTLRMKTFNGGEISELRFFFI